MLLAAERHPRRFGPREVELLAALASHAAVAIRNADLFAQTRAAADQLLGANAALRHANELRQRAADLREQLTDKVIRGAALSEITAGIGHEVGAPVAVFGADGELLAGERGVWSPSSGEDMPSTLQTIDATGGHAVVVPIVLRSGHAGVVVASSDGPLDAEATRLLSIGSTTVALVIASERAVAEARLRTQGEFVNALLSPDADEPASGAALSTRTSGWITFRPSSCSTLAPTACARRAGSEPASSRAATDSRRSTRTTLWGSSRASTRAGSKNSCPDCTRANCLARWA